MGRFVSAEPIGYAGVLNLYAYAPNPVDWVDPIGLSKKISGTPRQAQRKVLKKQAPLEIDCINEPEEIAPQSQWHAQCQCGPGYNQDGSIHDEGKGEVTFGRKRSNGSIVMTGALKNEFTKILRKHSIQRILPRP